MSATAHFSQREMEEMLGVPIEDGEVIDVWWDNIGRHWQVSVHAETNVAKLPSGGEHG